jgi:hypothetical protein
MRALGPDEDDDGEKFKVLCREWWLNRSSVMRHTSGAVGWRRGEAPSTAQAWPWQKRRPGLAPAQWVEASSSRGKEEEGLRTALGKGGRSNREAALGSKQR